MEDWVAGILLLVIALVMLCGALMLMVKLLNSLLQGNFISLTQPSLFSHKHYHFQAPLPTW